MNWPSDDFEGPKTLAGNRFSLLSDAATASSSLDFTSTQLAENLFNDLKETKKDDNKITEQINSLGKKILNENIEEIEKILNV